MAKTLHISKILKRSLNTFSPALDVVLLDSGTFSTPDTVGGGLFDFAESAVVGFFDCEAMAVVGLLDLATLFAFGLLDSGFILSVDSFNSLTKIAAG